jgi:hypothetical protein
VLVETAPGSHFAGQAFELQAGVVAGAERPRVEPPRIAGARVWPIGTGLKPIVSSGIGTVVAQQNLFLSQFRVVPGRAGTLEIPPIVASVDGRSGRSPAKRLEIQPVPIGGRPAEFLGGVGPFALNAEAVPRVIRLGQDLNYRITVSGPAAWGTTGRPDLARARQSEPTLKVIAEPDEAIDEPPSRTFVYRVKPARSGEVVLPPVAIATFDPALKRYVTKVTASVVIRVVTAPPFNPASIDSLAAPSTLKRGRWEEWTVWTLSAVLLLAASIALARVRMRRRRKADHGPAAARAFAARLARRMGRPSQSLHQDAQRFSVRPELGGGFHQPNWEEARQICEDLTRYLQLGTGRPVGALTPIEAQRGVFETTGSDELGAQAQRLIAQCDRTLYGAHSENSGAPDLWNPARRLFHALGRIKSSPGRGRVRPHP